MEQKIRLYRAMRERELDGISSVKPLNFGELLDYKFFLDAMYSHEIPSHVLHVNNLFYSWSLSYDIAKAFFYGLKGTGGYARIAYIDIYIDDDKFPSEISNEILFAYPLFRRQNWLDMLILREYYGRSRNKEYTGHILLNNFNYKEKREPLNDSQFIEYLYNRAYSILYLLRLKS